MEGAEAFEVAARPGELDGLSDHVFDGDTPLYLGYDIIIRHKLDTNTQG
jgi:hypothetical protein